MAQSAMARNVSFRPEDLVVVQTVARDLGLSFSAMLRQIIREWQEQAMVCSLVQAYRAGVITDQETLDRLAVLAERAGGGLKEAAR